MRKSNLFNPPPLTRIVPWSQQLACEVLQAGDLAVDLTAGKGRDTLALAQAVGHEGQVIAFDVQAEALEQTSVFLKENGLDSQSFDTPRQLPRRAGISLVLACHSRISGIVPAPFLWCSITRA